MTSFILNFIGNMKEENCFTNYALSHIMKKERELFATSDREREKTTCEG